MVNLEQLTVKATSGYSDQALFISYWDKDFGELKMIKLPLRRDQLYNYIHCDPSDLKKDRKFKSHKGKTIKRIPARRLNKFRKIEILNDLPKRTLDKIFSTTPPKKTFADIEVYSPDEFPEEEEAKHPIVTNCWCDEEGNVWLQGLISLNELEIQTLERRANVYLNDIKKTHLKKKYKLHYLYYESEKSLLEDYIYNWSKKFHLILGWNYLKFDCRYISNRCKRLGVEYSRMSPTGNTFNWSLSDKHQRDVKHNIELPMHKPIMDYMKVFEEFDRSVKLKTNVSLDNIGELVVGIKKVPFQGSLAELYISDPKDFLLYAIIDPVIVQLIDQELDTYSTLHAISTVGKVDHFDGFHASAVANTLFSDYYKKERNQMLVPEYGDDPTGTYSGGFVLAPVTGLHNDVLIHDFTSFFPAGMMAFNMGVDSKLGRLHPSKINTYTTPKGRIHNEINELDRSEELVYYNDFNEESPITDDMSITANGTIYDKNQNSSLNDLIWSLFNGRVKEKRNAADMGAVYEALKQNNSIKGYEDRLEEWNIEVPENSDIETVLRMLNRSKISAKNLSDALKIIMNSMYGVVGYARFILYNKEVAESVTTQSRMVIKHAISKVNDYFGKPEEDSSFSFWTDTDLHEKMGIANSINIPKTFDSKNPVVKYADTDSIMTSLGTIYSSIDWDELIESGKVDLEKLSLECVAAQRINLDLYQGDKKVYHKVLFFLFMDEFCFQPFFKRTFFDYCVKHNANPNMQDGSQSYSLGLEQINKNMLWTGKKHYIKNPIWDDGTAMLPESNIQVKGLPVNKSSYPKYIRESLRTIITAIMYEGEGLSYTNIVKIVRNIREGFEVAGVENVSIAERLNKYHAYCISHYPEISLLSGTPANVRAAASYNHMRNMPSNKMFLTQYPDIKDGTKIQYFLTKDKNLKYFGFNVGDYPMEIAPEIDWEAQFSKMILDPLNLVFFALKVEKLDSNLISFSPLF